MAMWFTFGGGGEDRKETHVTENSFFWFWVCEDAIVCLFLLPLIILPAFNGFLLLLCLKVNVALMTWGEVFSLSGLLNLLMGVESKCFDAQFRGMASRKPLFVWTMSEVSLSSQLFKDTARLLGVHFVQAKSVSLISGVLGFILKIRRSTATTNISVF